MKERQKKAANANIFGNFLFAEAFFAGAIVGVVRRATSRASSAAPQRAEGEELGEGVERRRLAHRLVERRAGGLLKLLGVGVHVVAVEPVEAHVGEQRRRQPSRCSDRKSPT